MSKNNLIEKLLDNAKDVVDKIKRPLVINKIKRGVAASKDDLIDKKGNAELDIASTYEAMVKDPENVTGYLNQLIAFEEEIEACDRTMNYITKIEHKLFKEDN